MQPRIQKWSVEERIWAFIWVGFTFVEITLIFCYDNNIAISRLFVRTWLVRWQQVTQTAMTATAVPSCTYTHTWQDIPQNSFLHRSLYALLVLQVGRQCGKSERGKVVGEHTVPGTGRFSLWKRSRRFPSCVIPMPSPPLTTYWAYF